jgi:uncharacterized protein
MNRFKTIAAAAALIAAAGTIAHAGCLQEETLPGTIGPHATDTSRFFTADGGLMSVTIAADGAMPLVVTFPGYCAQQSGPDVFCTATLVNGQQLRATIYNPNPVAVSYHFTCGMPPGVSPSPPKPAPVAAVQPKWCSSPTKAAAEVTICQTPSLWAFDDELTVIYDQALQLSGAGRASLVASETAWLRQRENCGINIECLTDTYRTRIAQVSQILAAERAPRPVAPPPAARPATPLPSAALGTALGCFKDQGDATPGTNGRDLDGFVMSSPAMTTTACMNTCRAQGFRFAGMQSGNQCFCGNNYGRSGTATDCNTKCSGDAAEICGGTWANSVYQVQ